MSAAVTSAASIGVPKAPHPALNMDIPALDEKQVKRALIAADHDSKKKLKRSRSSQSPSTHPPATSVLLQGNPRQATKNLFLFPDGSGAAASYTHLTLISRDLAVYGLNCPYLRSPQDWKCGPQDLTPLFISEIQRRQPSGPYYIGGYSTGGIAAFDAAQALDKLGEKVERLILIDSPCPIHIQRLPSRLMDYLKRVHAFNSRGRPPPAWVFEHFEANTTNLQKYRPRPFEAYKEPRTHIIYARQGVCESFEAGVPQMEILEEDPKEMKWIMCARSDFGPLGWEKLLNEEEIFVEIVEGANHFGMMRGDAAERLAGCIGRAVA
ncbi:thioesterase domain-containing protein [Dothistroma septosporum NZE10]|uniref:Thioesterase domain-containing protein n=2 Tax=Dothistroma septosporum TaxID=64363 RepID=M2YIA4_DOTSN|nr:putative thioesterase [Dothistroma septosporum]EME38646.1 thioesterase domain-containing protein [Dothistroma septosporum NZE10]